MNWCHPAAKEQTLINTNVWTNYSLEKRLPVEILMASMTCRKCTFYVINPKSYRIFTHFEMDIITILNNTHEH